MEPAAAVFLLLAAAATLVLLDEDEAAAEEAAAGAAAEADASLLFEAEGGFLFLGGMAKTKGTKGCERERARAKEQSSRARGQANV
jgi:hypothetical protein